MWCWFCEQALQVLTRWLKLRPTITDGDLEKIFKGLFYTFWHSDKQPVQVRARRFAARRPPAPRRRLSESHATKHRLRLGI